MNVDVGVTIDLNRRHGVRVVAIRYEYRIFNIEKGFFALIHSVNVNWVAKIAPARFGYNSRNFAARCYSLEVAQIFKAERSIMNDDRRPSFCVVGTGKRMSGSIDDNVLSVFNVRCVCSVVSGELKIVTEDDICGAVCYCASEVVPVGNNCGSFGKWISGKVCGVANEKIAVLIRRPMTFFGCDASGDDSDDSQNSDCNRLLCFSI